MYKTETDGYKMDDMLYNLLNSEVRRSIETCNFNRHIGDTHPDRIMEWHDLIYIRSGSWSISQDGYNYALSAGDIILLQAGHHHYGRRTMRWFPAYRRPCRRTTVSPWSCTAPIPPRSNSTFAA